MTVTKLFMDKNDILTWLVCPITRQLIAEIGIASDGQIYEKSIIENWLLDHDTSPVTGLQISDQVNNCHMLQTILDNYCKKNQSIQKKRFQKSTLHRDNITLINNIIANKKFSKLLGYSEFDLALIQNFDIIKYMDLTVFEYFINNILDLEFLDKNHAKLIHHVCKSRSFDAIKLLVEKKG